MATSSIFTNPVISDPEKAKEFIDNYIDMIEKGSADRNFKDIKAPLTEIEKIQEFMSQRFPAK